MRKVFFSFKSEITGEGLIGGSERIRTPGTFSGTPVFKTGTFDRSVTLPFNSFDNVSISCLISQ